MPTARKPRGSRAVGGRAERRQTQQEHRREHEREGVRGEGAAEVQPRDEQPAEDGTGRHLDVQGHPDPGVRAHQLLRPDERRQGAPSGRREQRVERGREGDEPQQDRERRIEPGDRAEDRGLAEVARDHQRSLLDPVHDDARERSEESRDRRREQKRADGGARAAVLLHHEDERDQRDPVADVRHEPREDEPTERPGRPDRVGDREGAHGSDPSGPGACGHRDPEEQGGRGERHRALRGPIERQLVEPMEERVERLGRRRRRRRRRARPRVSRDTSRAVSNRSRDAASILRRISVT